jgi:hypothetical protein
MIPSSAYLSRQSDRAANAARKHRSYTTLWGTISGSDFSRRKKGLNASLSPGPAVRTFVELAGGAPRAWTNLPLAASKITYDSLRPSTTVITATYFLLDVTATVLITPASNPAGRGICLVSRPVSTSWTSRAHSLSTRLSSGSVAISELDRNAIVRPGSNVLLAKRLTSFQVEVSSTATVNPQSNDMASRRPSGLQAIDKIELPLGLSDLIGTRAIRRNEIGEEMRLRRTSSPRAPRQYELASASVPAAPARPIAKVRRLILRGISIWAKSMTELERKSRPAMARDTRARPLHVLQF